jgi:5-methyltetrahydropteroyltriglutamate--homocysteine methyltransferase
VIRAMYADKEGMPIEPATFAQRVASAVEEVVRKQAGARADVINDGEMSKPSYATYIMDTAPRLSVPHHSLGRL